MLRRLDARAAWLALPLCALLLAACGESSDNTRPNNSGNANNANAANARNADTPAPSPGTDQTASGVTRAKLNLNTASEQEFLSGVPNLGKKMAHEFEEYRPYRSIQQFRREMAKYVDATQINEYEKYVFVPIDVNESDAATLLQIPGLDAGEAQALIAGRPYADNEAFLSKLAGSVSEADLAVAKNYLKER